MRGSVALFALISAVLFGQDVLNQGVAAFKHANYREAIEFFQKAVAEQPNEVAPHLYLGSAYLSIWVPGAAEPENESNAKLAETEFKRVLELDPNNKVAIASMASLEYNWASGFTGEEKVRKFDQAADWYQRLQSVDPGNKEAPYSLGVIAWTKWYPVLMTARAKAGMKAPDPGPLVGPAREALKAEYSSLIEEGIANLKEALRLDPHYGDAMAYMNLLIRERADLRDTKEEYEADIATADEWLNKSLQEKRQARSGSEIPPPPPEPPAPPTSAVRDGRPQTIHPVVKVEPVYPQLARQARIEGTVSFVLTIGTDGSIQNIQLVSGHPLLVEAALHAVRQYIYNPVMRDGQPVEAITPVDIHFSLQN
jgi:TonB family protein